MENMDLQIPLEAKGVETTYPQVKQPQMDFDEVLRMGVPGESNLTISFKKVVQVRSYETETIEVTTSAELREPVSGIERMFVTALLKAQAEYGIYIDLYYKKQISRAEFESRKDDLEKSLGLLREKAESVLGENCFDKYKLTN